MKNSAYHHLWAKLTLTNNRPAPNKMIRIRELPEIQRLEDVLTLGMHSRTEAARAQEEQIAALICRELFGISDADTHFRFPENYRLLSDDDPEKWDVDDAYNAHEDYFETPDMTDDEAVEWFAGRNVDFSDTKGWPLRCTKLICRVVEAVIKGKMGRLPDMSRLAIDRWEQALERDAKAFLDRKRKSS